MGEHTDKEQILKLAEENEQLGRAIHADAALVAALAQRVELVASGIRAAVVAADIPEETAKTILSLCDELGGGSASRVPGPSMTDVAAERDEARKVYIVTYYDNTAGHGVSGVYRDKHVAVEAAWENARECTRDWAKEKGYPKEGERYERRQVIHIEYGVEAWVEVIQMELK